MWDHGTVFFFYFPSLSKLLWNLNVWERLYQIAIMSNTSKKKISFTNFKFVPSSRVILQLLMTESCMKINALSTTPALKVLFSFLIAYFLSLNAFRLIIVPSVVLLSLSFLLLLLLLIIIYLFIYFFYDEQRTLHLELYKDQCHWIVLFRLDNHLVYPISCFCIMARSI